MRRKLHIQDIFACIWLYLVLGIVGFFFLLPALWMIKSAISPSRLVFAIPPRLLFWPTFENFGRVIFGGEYLTVSTDFIRAYTNSLVVALGSSGVATIAGTLAGYAIARSKLSGKRHIMFWILTTRMAPPLSTILPLYVLFRVFNLVDTQLGLIILYLTFNLPLVVWLMAGFYQEMPPDLEEASMLDGCSFVGAFIRIALPLGKGMMIAAFIVSIIFSWNEFLLALIMTGLRAQTAPVLAYSYKLHTQVLWGPLTALGTLISLPVIVLVVLTQKSLLKSLTFGII